MKQVFFHISAVLSLCLFSVDNAVAQTTHAHSTATQWHGINVLDMLSHPGNYGDFSTNGKKIYLYNVGTGCFAIEGGNWAMEARLFHEDFGREMTLLRIGNDRARINTGITETNISADKNSLICNLPGVIRGSGWVDGDQYSLTTIMDGQTTNGNLYFERVETDPNATTFTYYIYQKPKKTKSNVYLKYLEKDVDGTIKFYLGAAYGEWCSDGTTQFSGGENYPNKKGCGFYVHIDDDRSCWTTAGQATTIDNESNIVHTGDAPGTNYQVGPVGNDVTVDVKGDMVPIKELYQWRVISEDEFLQVLNEEVVGINPSISSLVPDRDFTRNSDDFFGTDENRWNVYPTPEEQTTGDLRYGYTWGNYEKKTNQRGVYFSEAWDAPVRLKEVFEFGNVLRENIKRAKFGFMSFEGKGSVRTTFTVPNPGWYQVECKAICFGPHDAYMFAETPWGANLTESQKADNSSAYLGYGKVDLERKDNISDVNVYSDVDWPTSNVVKNNQNLNLAIGQVLTFHGEEYSTKFWVYIDPVQFHAVDGQGDEDPDNHKLTIGFGKNDATKSSTSYSNGGNTYWYDTDWVCIDDIRVSYMGLAPAFFYEEEENLDYLVYDANYINERPSAQINGQYSGALSLERTFKKNQWNSFSFPIPLTGEQIRQAFGEDAELLELHSIGGLSHEQAQANSKYMIDFQTVELKQAVTDPTNVPVVVEPGKFYLLKPTADPVGGVDPKGRVASYYELGRNFFSVDATQVPSGYAHTIMDVTTPYSNSAIQSWNGSEVVTGGDNDGVAYVCYIQTPGYAEWTTSWLDSNNKYNHTQDGSYQGTDIYNRSVNLSGNVYSQMYAPKGAYVMSDGKMYELNKDTRLKGFRGWITLTHSLFSDDSSSAQIGISIDGVVDGDYNVTGVEAQTIVPLPVPDNTTVYDLCGRKVGTVGMTLPHGIYIVAGKKMYVK